MDVIIQNTIDEEFKEFMIEVLEEHFPKWDYEECSIEDLEEPKEDVKILILNVNSSDQDYIRYCSLKQMFYSDVQHFILIIEDINAIESLDKYQDPVLKIISNDEEQFRLLISELKQENINSLMNLPLDYPVEIVEEMQVVEKEHCPFSLNTNTLSVTIEEDKNNGADIYNLNFIPKESNDDEDSVNINNLDNKLENIASIEKENNEEQEQEQVLGSEDSNNGPEVNIDTAGHKEIEKHKEAIADDLKLTANGKPIDKQEIKEYIVERKQFEKRIFNLRDHINIPVYKKKTIPHRAIGIWSPLHRSGVTTLSINLALYLSEYAFPIGVLESITPNMKQKSSLSLFSNMPKNWLTYSKFLNGEGKPEQVVWDIKGIHFYPFIEEDTELKWNEQRLEYFIEGLKFYDLLLVDLPTGKMEPYTEKILPHLDELWIIGNNDISGVLEWKEYIDKVIKSKITCKLIFNEHLQFSKPDLLEIGLGIPLIAKLPSMHIEINKNQYKTLPLLEQDHVYNKLEPHFVKLLEQITGDKKEVLTFEKKPVRSTIEIFLKKFMNS
ncbi:hypothetical protein BTXL6_10375 [Bacillus thuringiensis]|nr:hypothetical protein BTXL6_27940 [Bacillus thuringiensis]ALL21842.1 hypothetical protein BTXL6_10375 [Bacillus thuringiensis]EEM19097.1 hypothetical protein bthur0001_57360 [Bacillus thuringiensis serovar tochigiensis BGSC 4Y1]